MGPPQDVFVSTPPVMSTPSATSSARVPEFTWTEVTEAPRYDLWVNNVTTGQRQIIRQENLTTTSFISNRRLPPGRYRAWSRAFNEQGEPGDWSKRLTFVVMDVPTVTSPVAR